MKNIGMWVVSLMFLPIVVTVDVFRSSRGVGRKFLYVLLVWFLFGGTWIRGYVNLKQATEIVLYETGVVDKRINIPVRGTSMLPTVLDGAEVTLHNPNKYQIERGDIVSFSNIETGGQYYLKRVIGLEGEKIMIKDGQIQIDGKFLRESYTKDKDLTYGNTFLVECQVYEVPQGTVAVFGDNRIASTDTRVIGFVKLNDIDGVNKTNVRPEFGGTVVETKEVMPFNTTSFVERLNKKRSLAKVAPLYLMPKLSETALSRANKVAANVNEWKQNQALVSSDLDKINYDYLVVQEIVTMGNYTEDQLVEHLLELVPYNSDFLSDRYYEIGIGVSSASQGECKIPVINIILNWPSKPSSSQGVVDSLQQDIDTYSQIVSQLKQLQSVPNISRDETDKLISTATSLLAEANRFRTAALEGRWATEAELNQNDLYIQSADQFGQELAKYVSKYKSLIEAAGLSDLTAYRWGNREFNEESNRTKLLFGQSKYDEMLTAANTLLTLAVNDEEKAIGNYWKGLAHYNLNQHVTAESSLLEAIRLNPAYSAPYVTLAAIEYAKTNYQKGFEYAQKCVELDPDYGWCYNNLAIGYMNLGQKSLALTAMEKAVSLDPDSYVFQENLKRMRQSL